MKDGFLKVAAAAPPLRVADCSYNKNQLLCAISQAHALGVNLLVLPELCLTGATCGDLFHQQALLSAASSALLALAAAVPADMLVVAGLPLAHGGSLYSCAAVLLDGRVLGLVPSRALPEASGPSRPFVPGPASLTTHLLEGQPLPFGANLLFRCTTLPSLCLGVELGQDFFSPASSSAALALAGATVLACPAADAEGAGRPQYRRSLVVSQSARLACASLYAGPGPGESSTDGVFSGHCLLAENGVLLAENPPFGEGFTLTEVDLERLAAARRRTGAFSAGAPGFSQVEFSLPLATTSLTRHFSPFPFVPEKDSSRARRCEELLTLQSAALEKRLSHLGCPVPVLGISGGLDSTLALLVVCRAMDHLSRPRSQIVAVTMPCFGTTSRTLDNAVALCRELGVALTTVDISASVRRHFQDIGHLESVQDAAYENAQARERTQVLMDLANQLGGLVVGTGDLSELALGWATYNGDHMSMYGVNASVPKTLMRHMVAFAASQSSPALSAVLLDVVATPVSPELLPSGEGAASQQTEALVGPYELHDFFLYYLVRWGFSPSKIYRLACHAFAGVYEESVILSWLKVFCRRFFSQQFKRSCLPDGPAMGSVSLSPRGAWQMPSDASSALWLAQLASLE